MISQGGDQVCVLHDGVHGADHLHAVDSHVTGQRTGVLLHLVWVILNLVPGEIQLPSTQILNNCDFLVSRNDRVVIFRSFFGPFSLWIFQRSFNRATILDLLGSSVLSMLVLQGIPVVSAKR